ncbi:MAG TPA: metal-sensitive transcriptional regulator [Virgibacillus sp.]|nr:metal-sensitive transcriptional regulator [Virgibacillus sp.]
MEFTPEVKNRLKRVEGQVRGVLRMMEEGKECKDVISQLSAVRSAVDRSIAYIVAQNLKHCVQEQQENGEDSSDVVEEAIQLLVKSR